MSIFRGCPPDATNFVGALAPERRFFYFGVLPPSDAILCEVGFSDGVMMGKLFNFRGYMGIIALITKS